MNAPWKPGSAGRDPFHAYVCDDHSFDMLRAVAAEMGWPLEKVHKGGLRNAVQSLSMAASPNVLFVDLSESGDPLNDIGSLAEVCEPGTVVIAAGQVNDVRLYRDLIASGIQDYLLKPFSPDHLRDSVANAQAVFLAPKLDATQERAHVTATVIGARGGCGASTIATSLAWLWSAKDNRATSLLDLDVHFGTGALAMDLEPGRGLTDAIENPSRIDGLFIERAMVRANDNLAILSAEAPISQPLLTDGGAFYQLQEEMRGAFECTVVDLPRHMLVNHPHLMADANVVVLTSEFTLAAARDTIRLLSWLKSNAPHARVVVAANKVQPVGQEMSRKDFEQSIERKVDVLLPYDPKSAAQAAKLGKTLAEAAKSAKIGQAIAQLGRIALQAGEPEPEDGAAKGARAKPARDTSGASLMGKLADIKSLLPRRKARESEPAE
jgi:pilus assembly protein CpaE